MSARKALFISPERAPKKKKNRKELSIVDDVINTDTDKDVFDNDCDFPPLSPPSKTPAEGRVKTMNLTENKNKNKNKNLNNSKTNSVGEDIVENSSKIITPSKTKNEEVKEQTNSPIQPAQRENAIRTTGENKWKTPPK